MIRFEWNKQKAKKNLSKHKVGFEEACTVFDDDFAKIFFDEIHSDDEVREIIVGYSFRNRFSFVLPKPVTTELE